MESNLVFGEGNINCDVMFIGEAPGGDEDRLRQPFKGPCGQLLDQVIECIGWKRAEVYISNIEKRRPPDKRDPLKNRRPSASEIEAYKPYLTREIETINPNVVCTLGRFSMNYFLPLAKLKNDHGRILRLTVGSSIRSIIRELHCGPRERWKPSVKTSRNCPSSSQANSPLKSLFKR
jgi:uracil-DNA glycosylase